MTTFPSAKLTFSYQSECHCAKTAYFNVNHNLSLVTSQNVTAPKQSAYFLLFKSSLVTSQNVTAPKQLLGDKAVNTSLVTSQNVTAPKRLQIVRIHK